MAGAGPRPLLITSAARSTANLTILRCMTTVIADSTFVNPVSAHESALRHVYPRRGLTTPQTRRRKPYVNHCSTTSLTQRVRSESSVHPGCIAAALCHTRSDVGISQFVQSRRIAVDHGLTVPDTRVRRNSLASQQRRKKNDHEETRVA